MLLVLVVSRTYEFVPNLYVQNLWDSPSLWETLSLKTRHLLLLVFFKNEFRRVTNGVTLVCFEFLFFKNEFLRVTLFFFLPPSIPFLMEFYSTYSTCSFVFCLLTLLFEAWKYCPLLLLLFLWWIEFWWEISVIALFSVNWDLIRYDRDRVV